MPWKWNAVERIFREVKRRTYLFPNCFRHVEPETAETWLESLARWHNALNITPGRGRNSSVSVAANLISAVDTLLDFSRLCAIAF